MHKHTSIVTLALALTVLLLLLTGCLGGTTRGANSSYHARYGLEPLSGIGTSEDRPGGNPSRSGGIGTSQSRP